MNELTPRVTKLFDDIQKRITGRFAMWPMDAVALYCICSMQDGPHLEIGTAFGGSAILARKAKEDANRHDTIYSIDPLNGFYGKNKPDPIAGKYPTLEMVLDNFEKFNVSNIQLVLAETPPLPKELDGLMFGSVLIDGNHNGMGPLNDWNCVKDRVLPGGVVMFHDIHKEDVNKAVEKADNEPGGWTMIRRYLKRGHGMPSQSHVRGNEIFGSHAILRKG